MGGVSRPSQAMTKNAQRVAASAHRLRMPCGRRKQGHSKGGDLSAEQGGKEKTGRESCRGMCCLRDVIRLDSSGEGAFEEEEHEKIETYTGCQTDVRTRLAPVFNPAL